MDLTSFPVGNNEVKEEFEGHGEKSGPPRDEEHDSDTEHRSSQAQPHVVVL